MPPLLLAPYNESMRLGQGYNSFLQTPCIEQAVTFYDEDFQHQEHAEDKSQTATYSAKLVTKFSELVHSLNGSAASCIKNGSIGLFGGGAFSVDEVKFAESDLNLVVSVKVVKGTGQKQCKLGFNPPDLTIWNDQTFHETYGDCFISGFIEGGELHGIVSIKVLDASKRQEVTEGLRGFLNVSSSTNPWSLGDLNAINQCLQDTETNVTVNWCGGGFIKPEQEEWDFNGLMRAAEAFANRVAECPRKTWAILSRYDTVPAWQKWAREHRPTRIEARDYDDAQALAAESLDIHIGYKAIVSYIQKILQSPDKYDVAKRPDAYPVTIVALSNGRRQIKKEMDRIVSYIEELDRNPAAGPLLQSKEEFTLPELWRARLPVPREKSTDERDLPME